MVAISFFLPYFTLYAYLIYFCIEENARELRALFRTRGLFAEESKDCRFKRLPHWFHFSHQKVHLFLITVYAPKADSPQVHPDLFALQVRLQACSLITAKVGDIQAL